MSVQFYLGNFQWWEFYHVPGKIVPVTGWSHCKKMLSYIKVKCLMEHLVQIVPCSLHVAPCEETPSFHAVAALEALGNCDVAPSWAFCSSGWNYLSPQSAGFSALWETLWPSSGPSIQSSLIGGSRKRWSSPDRWSLASAEQGSLLALFLLMSCWGRLCCWNVSVVRYEW